MSGAIYGFVRVSIDQQNMSHYGQRLALETARFENSNDSWGNGTVSLADQMGDE